MAVCIHSARPGSCHKLVLTLSLLSPLLAVAQDGTYQVPRIQNGAPDLQGTWTNNTITPLTRPAEFADLNISAAQALAWEQRIADYTVQQDQPSDPGRAAPSKDEIELADSYNNFWFDDGTRVAEYDGQYRSSLLVDPADGQLPDYTGQARARIAQQREQRNQQGPFDGPEARPLPERCLLAFGSSSGPPMLPILYNNHYQIVQSPGYVMILVEMVHDVRIIRIDSESLPASMHPWMGDSTGHWEGDTLVVETTRINAHQQFRNSSPQMQVTERFTRVADDTINYQFTVHDPATFVSDFSGEIPMKLTDERLYEYACHEGNYALTGVLAGARKEEVEQEFGLGASD
ncbi:MAG: hypothetical protein R3F41_14825 [Gammaproteobacteria bacterium]|nr:hypothetical protein [Pseudomonadales bacterium]MCP5346913.1 hypothetical protein [Pseudomonadales bacterium]